VQNRRLQTTCWLRRLGLQVSLHWVDACTRHHGRRLHKESASSDSYLAHHTTAPWAVLLPLLQPRHMSHAACQTITLHVT
jgi:hypothetical protein